VQSAVQEHQAIAGFKVRCPEFLRMKPLAQRRVLEFGKVGIDEVISSPSRTPRLASVRTD
jgi:hypothetical protein